MEKNKKIKIICCCLFFAFFSFTRLEAALLSVSPSTGQYGVGSSFNVEVVVSSVDQPINVVSGEITFDTARLEVISVSKNNSIIGLWVQEPGFSNVNGYVRFEGIILNPGYTGGKGKVLGINFKAKQSGTVKLLFSGASVLANDGEGTDVLVGLGHGDVTIVGEMVSTTTTTKAMVTNTIATTKPKTVVTTTTKALDSKINNTFFDDSLAIVEIFRDKKSNPNVKFEINILDKKWDHDYYEIRIDNSKKINWDNKDSNIFSAPLLKPGGHIIEVKSFNKKGEMISAKKGFIIEPLNAPELKSPVKKLNVWEDIVLRGVTDYPLSEVSIKIKKQKQSFSLWGCGGSVFCLSNAHKNPEFLYYTTVADEKGHFSLDLHDKLLPGVYFVTTKVTDNNGGLSHYSEEEKIEIERGGILENETLVFVMRNLGLALIFVVIVFVAKFLCNRYINKKTKNILNSKNKESELSEIVNRLSIKIDKINKSLNKKS